MRHPTGERPLRTVLAGAVVVFALGGCDTGRRLEVIVCGDVALPRASSSLCDDLEEQGDGGTVVGAADIDTVSIHATTDTGEVIYRASVDMCDWDLPFTAELWDGWDTVTVEVGAWGPSGIIRSTARPTFPASGVHQLHMGLTDACLNVLCPAGRTCVDGVCEPVTSGWGSSICRSH